MIRSFYITLRLLPELASCLSILGWNLGWRYWRIMRRAAIRPELALEWAKSCRLRTIVQPEDAAMFHKWADELENNYAKYLELMKPNELEWITYDANHLEARPDPGLAYLLVEDTEGKWLACAITGQMYKRVSTISPDAGETLEEAKARCAGHWEILNAAPAVSTL